MSFCILYSYMHLNESAYYKKLAMKLASCS